MNMFDSIVDHWPQERRPWPLFDWIGALLSPERADLAETLRCRPRREKYAACKGQEDNDARQ